ncbi:enoyl-CoA hydratase/isomerase family protein [Pseudonocardia endophytica]|uniref:Enoyl-CoA hydratase/carnithine racemase n=1 Tax=Pseudonocardia endophytica TaxID=401976 RepID=A0A4R1HHP6_PSEEN|nr:enoyl-CoA hydratase/isomerase family protein [Pseudonocardia endophytica]TCK21278.1 enoyl-CoA hydratase/carnithine racemase [Pseudonocardia endophytica]
MEQTPVRIDEQDGLAVVTVDAPPLNLFDDAMHLALLGALDELESSRPRAVLFRFEGRIVTGGVDIAMFERLDRETAAEVFASLISITRRTAALPAPTVFAAHERCLTWGVELALACDLIVAADAARFGLIEATVGLTPAMGGTQRLAERAGIGRATEFVLTGDLYDAATLHSWGVVNQVLPVEGFDDATRALSRRLASGPTVAHAATKAVLASYRDGGVEGADADVPAIAGALFDTEDLPAALRTFRESGPGRTEFRGR